GREGDGAAAAHHRRRPEDRAGDHHARLVAGAPRAVGRPAAEHPHPHRHARLLRRHLRRPPTERPMTDFDDVSTTVHGFETRAIHAGQPPDPVTGAVVTPISLATTFAQTAVGEHAGYEYSRSGNPTR